MNKQELILLTRSQLGEPVVKVEIDDTQFDTILVHAKLWFRSRKGLIAATRISLTPGKSEYDLPENCDRIIEVILPGREGGLDISNGVTELVPSWLWSPYSTGAHTFDTSQYAQVMSAMEQFKRVFSQESGWFEQHGRLWIANGAGCGSEGGQALVFFRKLTWEIEELRGRDEDLFYRYVVAFAKRILARIRGKYPSYPAAGGPISMDADTLITEANEELAKLEEEIIASQGATPFTVG
ncbi:MAG: hypothetical protein ACRCXD_09845 [Luteolibacter sp.]